MSLLRAPSCVPPAPALAAAPRDQARESGEWAGRISQRSIAPAASEASKCVNNLRYRQNRNETKNSTHQLAGGEHLKIPQRPVVAHGLGVDGAPRPGSRVLPQEGACSIRDLANAMGSAVSVISKMWSGLSIRGTTCRWWRKARTAPAVSPRSARFFSASRSESNRFRCWGEDTLWCQESSLSRSTKPV
jgi:hypothetical protein